MEREKLKNPKKIGTYILMEILGKGTFGVVYLAVSTVDGKKYAIKCQNKDFVNKNEMYRKLLNTEIGIMQKINHPNILHLFELLESSNNFYLVVDYCNNGDFGDYLKQRNVKFLEEKEVVYFLKQLMNGFKELRNWKIIHRDLKLSNLLVNDDTLKIGDFGLAKKGKEMVETILGSYLTMAPEILMSNGNISYNSKCDLWSIGFVFYQMLFGTVPFFGLTPNEIIIDIKKRCTNLEFPFKISESAKDLLRKLLTINPEERIDWPEFFDHSLFRMGPVKSLKDFVPMEELAQIDEVDKNVDKEFYKNKEMFLKKNRSNFDETQTLEVRVEPVKAKNINEEPVDEKDYNTYTNLQAVKEVVRRYDHEKKKVLFIVFTVRNIRKIMKIGFFQTILEPLFKITIMLLKKAITLTDLITFSLTNGNNIFKENLFEEFLKSPQFNDVLENFRADKPNFEKYKNYLLEKIDTMNLSKEVKTQIVVLSQENIILNMIDNFISSDYNTLKAFKLDSLTKLQDLNREYLLLLVSIFYCVNCEKYFPYKTDDGKFEWTLFYQMHERMSDDDLISIINRTVNF